MGNDIHSSCLSFISYLHVNLTCHSTHPFISYLHPIDTYLHFYHFNITSPSHLTPYLTLPYLTSISLSIFEYLYITSSSTSTPTPTSLNQHLPPYPPHQSGPKQDEGNLASFITFSCMHACMHSTPSSPFSHPRALPAPRSVAHCHTNKSYRNRNQVHQIEDFKRTFWSKQSFHFISFLSMSTILFDVFMISMVSMSLLSFTVYHPSNPSNLSNLSIDSSLDLKLWLASSKYDIPVRFPGPFTAPFSTVPLKPHLYHPPSNPLLSLLSLSSPLQTCPLRPPVVHPERRPFRPEQTGPPAATVDPTRRPNSRARPTARHRLPRARCRRNRA